MTSGPKFKSRISDEDARCEVLSVATEAVQSDPVVTAISIVAEDSTCNLAFIRAAIEAALKDPRFEALLIIAWNFDPNVWEEEHSRKGLNVHLVRANRDLMIEGLEVSAKDRAFVEIAEPHVDVHWMEDGRIYVSVEGFDVFDPRTGNISSGGKSDISCWMVDTNFDGSLFHARLFHFPGKDRDKQITRFQRAFRKLIYRDEWDRMISHTSSPFPRPSTGRIAVRITTNTGDVMETVKVIEER